MLGTVPKEIGIGHACKLFFGILDTSFAEQSILILTILSNGAEDPHITISYQCLCSLGIPDLQKRNAAVVLNV